MHSANRSFLAILGALALGLSIPTAVLAQVVEMAQPTTGESESVVAVAISQGNLTHFVSLIKKSGLAAELAEGGPYTVFAPTDDAFAALEQDGTVEAKNPQELRRLVRSHIAVGEWTSEKLAGADGITNLLADELEIDWKAQDGETGTTRQVDGADVIKADIIAANGVIHEIDAVLSAPPLTDMSATVEAGEEAPAGSTEAGDTGAGN